MRKTFESLTYGLILVLFSSGCGGISVNRAITINTGETVNHSLNTVNGRITVGDDFNIKGEVRTVNGGITVGENGKAGTLQTVNGSIKIGPGTKIAGDVNTVNGSIRCGSKAVIEGSLSTINGKIDLDQTTVTQDISIHNGDITLEHGTNVGGNIVVKDSKGNSSKRKKPLVIRLSHGSVVQGSVFNHSDKKVQLLLQGNSQVHGKTKNVELITEDQKSE
ncbi:MAG TPA: hypothetical protein EYQ50_13035 [Verrucomicrobiales bacterium]|nr:hypothetical protein [Verrucomicrobiales bacterium]HIL70714.1 hypothetical protein [Verrucomicrobiota bacterium]